MNKIIKFGSWILIVFCLLISISLHAQETINDSLIVNDAFTAGASSSTNILQFRLNGVILSTSSFTGTGGGLLSSDASLTGPAFLWYSTKAALWAGYAAAGNLSDTNIGTYSISLGYENVAQAGYTAAIGSSNNVSGQSGVAIGLANSVPGQNAVAIGANNVSSGNSSVQIGCYGNSTQSFSVGLGIGDALGSFSTAAGLSGATGSYATAFGNSAAFGQYSVALGQGAATQNYSFAAGCSSSAGGLYSCVIGNHLSTGSQDTTVFGAYNVGNGSTGWSPTDPLLEIGNGNGGTAGNGYTPILSDAFVVYKNGSASFQGPVAVATGGDIPMFTGY